VTEIGKECSIVDGREDLTRSDDASDGVAAGQEDAATIYLCRRDAGRVQIEAGIGDQLASTCWALSSLHAGGNPCVALLAELVGRHIHTLRLHRLLASKLE